MDVVSTGPLRTAQILWQSRPGMPVLTVVAKATFRLQPEESPLADEQDAPLEEDAYFGDDRSKSLYAPSDLSPFKPRADVLLVGSAFAPRKEPVRSLVARLIVADIDKSIEVFGERTLTRDGQLRDGFPFAKMPLRYERAAGGPETTNPVGVRVDGQPGPQGTVSLPNLQPRASSLPGTGDEIPPIGFGPIAATWPTRLASLGRHAGAWPQAGWTDRPVPEGVSPTYFNVAPLDQQIDAIRDSERILLENLHVDHPRLATALPGIRPRAMIERPGLAPEELKLKADTLWIDTDRGVCTVTWRGQVPLKHRVEPGRVVVSMDQPVARMLRGAMQAPAERAHPTPSPPAPRGSPRIAALSFADTMMSEGGSKAAPAASSPKTAEKIGTAPKRSWAERASSLLAAAEVDPDREVVSPSELTGMDSPDLAFGGPPTTASPAPGVVQAVAALPTLVPRPPTMPSAPMEPSAVTSRNPRRLSEPELDAVTPPRAGTSGASAPRGPREITKLIWLDSLRMPRIRADRRWRSILGQGGQRGAFTGDEADARESAAKSSERASSKDRRDVLALLARGEAIREGAVKQALASAIADDGTLDPPLVLVAGELELPFDELSALKATVMAASPLTMTDESLQEALDSAREFLKSTWPPGSGGLVAGILSRLKGALQAGGAGSGSMEVHTERMLLEQRCYQWRTVFGRRWIRGILRGDGDSTEATTVYLPEALRDELPLFRRIRVKLLGEADLQEDEAEPNACVIKVMALGRTAELP